MRCKPEHICSENPPFKNQGPPPKILNTTIEINGRLSLNIESKSCNGRPQFYSGNLIHTRKRPKPHFPGTEFVIFRSITLFNILPVITKVHSSLSATQL